MRGCVEAQAVVCLEGEVAKAQASDRGRLWWGVRSWLAAGSRWRRSVGGRRWGSGQAGVGWGLGLQARGRRRGRKDHWQEMENLPERRLCL